MKLQYGDLLHKQCTHGEVAFRHCYAPLRSSSCGRSQLRLARVHMAGSRVATRFLGGPGTVGRERERKIVNDES